MKTTIIAPEEIQLVDLLCECGKEATGRISIFNPKFEQYQFGLEVDSESGEDVPNWTCSKCKKKTLDSMEDCIACGEFYTDANPQSKIKKYHCMDCVSIGKFQNI